MSAFEFVAIVYAASALIAFATIMVAYAMAKNPEMDGFITAVAVLTPVINTIFILAVAFQYIPLYKVAACMEKMTPEEEDGFVSMPIKN